MFSDNFTVIGTHDSNSLDKAAGQTRVSFDQLLRPEPYSLRNRQNKWINLYTPLGSIRETDASEESFRSYNMLY